MFFGFSALFEKSWEKLISHRKFFSYSKLELKLKLIFFLQVEKYQEKNLNNSLGGRKVQNNPEKIITLSFQRVYNFIQAIVNDLHP